jgi:hypothetical protein
LPPSKAITRWAEYQDTRRPTARARRTATIIVRAPIAYDAIGLTTNRNSAGTPFGASASVPSMASEPQTMMTVTPRSVARLRDGRHDVIALAATSATKDANTQVAMMAKNSRGACWPARHRMVARMVPRLDSCRRLPGLRAARN